MCLGDELLILERANYVHTCPKNLWREVFVLHKSVVSNVTISLLSRIFYWQGGELTDFCCATTAEPYVIETIKPVKVSWQEDPRFQDSSSEEEDDEPEATESERDKEMQVLFLFVILVVDDAMRILIASIHPVMES